jgi:glycosyltransferase involved in cell wall biosynthesis
VEAKKSHSQPLLSVVLATHNEAANLPKCLEPIHLLADEIIIVDGESSDDTVKIAKSFGAKVISTTNKPNFHINKQMAMDEAKGNLVLQLDGDEVVDPGLLHFIEQAMNSSFQPDIAAWWIKRKNFFMGRFLTKGGQYPDPVIRLYRKGKARLPQRDVHEQMVVDGNTGWAEGHLLHYSNPTFADYLRKFNTYTTFKAQQLFDSDVKITLLNTIKYLWWLPTKTFFLLYFRHKGFMDAVPGLTFALWSGWHHSVAYMKLWEMYELQKVGKKNL